MLVAAEPRLEVGSIFQGGYEILSELGSGSFGRVYKARQLSTAQEVAIKVLRLLPGDGSADARVHTDRFRREMRLCGELAHPNIVRLIDSGQSEEGVLYTVFEYVPGATLKAVLAAEGKLGVRETVHLMTQVLDALSCAHARGVVHRDLKPENIMVTKTGVRRNAQILDFGLGGIAREAVDRALPRLTATQEVMGTPCYAAPEQLRGEPPSTRSDLYSWGLIFLECLTGELAVSGASAQEVVLRQLGPDPIPIPGWVRSHRIGRLLQTVTAKSIEKRDVTIEGLLQALSAGDFGDLHTTETVRTAQALPPGERRQLTLVCCRVSLSRDDGGAADLEELDALLHAHHAVVAEIAGRNSGQIAGIMGDRVLVAFGYPQAHEDDARRALRTARQVAGEVERLAARARSEGSLAMTARFGIHTGLVIARELRQTSHAGLDQLIGPTPQIAAALAEMAGPGEVLISADTQQVLRGELPGAPAGSLTLAEHGQPLAVFRLQSGVPAGLDSLGQAAETALIGRGKQREELVAAWTQATDGAPSAMLIRGEPGLGKSRLVRELRREVPGTAWLEARCALENQGAPLRPFTDLLSGRDVPFETLLTTYGFDLAETVPLFAGLMSQVNSTAYPPLPYTRERQKELTLNTLLTLLMRMSEAEPRVLVLEDLHWADPTTLELAGLVVQELRSAQALAGQPCRLCVVFTARPEFEAPWPTGDMAIMQLARLDHDQVAEMITAGLAHGRPLSATTVEEIVRRADGIPLFIEEVTRVLADAEAGRDAGDPLASAGPGMVPNTLRDLLTARLDGLPPAVKDTVQLAAVLGREFRYEILKAVSRKDESGLREDLADLTRSGLIFHRRSVRAESYVFKHALVRDTAYESMMRAARQDLHRRIATTLAQRFPDIEQHRPEIMAQHFEGAGEAARSAWYWNRAGERALRRVAYVEATQLLERGQALLESLSPSVERDRLEVELLSTLGTVLFSTKGYSSEDVEQTFARARALSEQIGEEAALKVLPGIASVYISRSDREATLAMVPGFRRLAERTDAPLMSMTGHALLAGVSLWTGDFLALREHTTVALRYHSTDEFKRFADEYGYDGGFFMYPYKMISLWNLGYPDQADALRREFVKIAADSGSPYSMLIALAFAPTLTHDRGEYEETLALCDRLDALATEQRLYFWLAASMCGRGGAMLQRGELDAAIPQIQQGLVVYNSLGVYTSYSYYLTYLATAHLAAGNLDEALRVIDEGLALVQTQLARFHEPELLRLKSDALLRQGDLTGAETHARQSLELSRRDSAKAFELRAAMALGRVLRDTDRRDEARSVVENTYNWFSEGFETRDLHEARSLLSGLA